MQERPGTIVPSPATALPLGGVALTADAVSKRYRNQVQALVDLSVQIAEGSSTALIGPNGAGKTTLLKLWMGFERPTSGSVSVAGFDPWRQRAPALRALGYLPQRPALYRELSVGEHLILGEALRREFDAEGARRRLGSLGIEIRRRAGELSGGEQAQLALSIALASGGSILLLDEPLASLDPLARRQFLAVVGDVVRHEGATVVLSSHIVTDIQGWCDRVIVLGAGRLRLHESVDVVLAGHAVGNDRLIDEGLEMVGRFPGSQGDPLTLWRLAKGATADQFGLRSPTLDEVVMGTLAANRASESAP
jgi:ABC-2 type transport system ATP-binding protein